MSNEVPFASLKGKTLDRIEGLDAGGDHVTFATSDGERFVMYHRHDCCESVTINDVCGDVGLLIGAPILEAYESTNQDNPPEDADSFTWTFYVLRTERGTVTIKWLGESNGYYSEGVDFERVTP